MQALREEVSGEDRTRQYSAGAPEEVRRKLRAAVPGDGFQAPVPGASDGYGHAPSTSHMFLAVEARENAPVTSRARRSRLPQESAKTLLTI